MTRAMVSTLLLVLLAFTSHTIADWVSVVGYGDKQCATAWEGVLVQELGVCNSFLDPIFMKYTYENGQLIASVCFNDTTCNSADACMKAPIPQNTCMDAPDRKRGLALSPRALARRALDSSSSSVDLSSSSLDPSSSSVDSSSSSLAPSSSSVDSSSSSLDSSSSSVDGSDSKDPSSSSFDWSESSSIEESSESSSSSDSEEEPEYAIYTVVKDFPTSYLETGKTMLVAEYVNVTCQGPVNMYTFLPATECYEVCFEGMQMNCKVPDVLLPHNTSTNATVSPTAPPAATSTTGVSTDAAHEEPHKHHGGIPPVGIAFIVIGVLAVVAVAGVVGYTYGKKNGRFSWGKLNEDTTTTAHPDF